MQWNYTKNATGTCVTFNDMDGSGPAFTNVDYHTAAALGAPPDSSWPTGACYTATGGVGLCDTINREN